MARRQAILATVAAAALLLLLLPHAAHAQDGKGKKHDVTEGGSAYHNGGCGPLPKVVGAGHFDLIGEGETDPLSPCPKPAEEGDICAADCKKGFLGTVAATCGADGEWTLVGECKKEKLVFCPGLPETGTDAEPFTTNADGGLCVDGEQGDTCVAACEPTFTGEATARCSAAAGWVVTSTCEAAGATCSGTPSTAGATTAGNWITSDDGPCTDVTEGTTCTSPCGPGGVFGGTAAATCLNTGLYDITTTCTPL